MFGHWSQQRRKCKDISIEWVNVSIRHGTHQYRAQNPYTAISYNAFQAEFQVSIQKDASNMPTTKEWISNANKSFNKTLHTVHSTPNINSTNFATSKPRTSKRPFISPPLFRKYPLQRQPTFSSSEISFSCSILTLNRYFREYCYERFHLTLEPSLSRKILTFSLLNEVVHKIGPGSKQ